MGRTSVNLSLISCLVIMPFDFGYFDNIKSGLKNTYIKNSSDNLTKSYMIYEMYGCQSMILKEINIIFVSVIMCSIFGNLINTST